MSSKINANNIKRGSARAGKIIVGVIAVLVIVGIANAHNNNYGSDTSTPQATITTVRNGFISGCDNGGQSTTTNAQECACAYDALTTYYNNNQFWAVNADGSETQVYQQIINNGYNTDQTNAMAHCWSNQ